jgi:hypothetical protein
MKLVYHSTVLGLLPSVWQESLKPSIMVFSSKTLDSISAFFENQVDINRDNQVDAFAEANKKSTPTEADSSVFSFDFPLFYSGGRPCMSKGRTKTFSKTFALVH